jgi:hypothetical protein
MVVANFYPALGSLKLGFPHYVTSCKNSLDSSKTLLYIE